MDAKEISNKYPLCSAALSKDNRRPNSQYGNELQFTKIIRIPTPCESQTGFSPLNLISPMATTDNLSVYQTSRPYMDREDPFTDFADRRVIVDEIDLNEHRRKKYKERTKRHRSWKIYKWLKGEEPKRKRNLDEEFEIITGLKGLYSDPEDRAEDVGLATGVSIRNMNTDDSTLFDEYVEYKPSQRCTSGQFSFMNISKLDDGINMMSTTEVNDSNESEQSDRTYEVQYDSGTVRNETESVFSFDDDQENTNFHSVANETMNDTLSKKTGGLLARCSLMHRTLQSSFRRRKDKGEEHELDDLRPMTPIGEVVSPQDESKSTVSRVNKFSLRSLFPGYQQQSAVSGYLAESPQKTLTERYLGENGIANLEQDLERLDKDPTLDIFGKFTASSPVKRRNLKDSVCGKRKKSLRDLFGLFGASEVEPEESDNDWNPYSKNYRTSSMKLKGKTSQVSFDSVKNKKQGETLSKYTKSGFDKLLNESLKELIRKKTMIEQTHLKPQISTVTLNTL